MAAMLGRSSFASAMIGGAGNAFGAEKPRRRPSQLERALHRTYAPPPSISTHKRIDSVFRSLYWIARSIQFNLLYKDIGGSTEEMVDLLAWESSVHPPSIEELRRRTQDAFSCKYIKYMYARFKNECPTGRMRSDEFKKMFGPYLPDRLNAEYLGRLFNAFAKGKGEITFQDLMEALAMLNSPNPMSNAVWTMRMIKGRDASRVNYNEFNEFVKSVFQLSLMEEKKQSLAMNPGGRHLSLQEAVNRRADEAFAALDTNKDGFVEVADLVDFFQKTEGLDPLLLKPSAVTQKLRKFTM